jgi:cysteinyl-tRNA synthetase
MHSNIQPLNFTLFDSYQKKEVTISPQQTVIPNTLKFYSCGPTIYSYQHIGNLRAAWFPTSLADLARLADWQVELVFNITDVGHLTGDNDGDADTGEDRMEKAAKKEQRGVEEIVNFYLDDYKNQCKALNIQIPEGKFNPKATEYIKEQIILALELLRDDKAYVLEDGIYFDSNSENNSSIFELINSFPGMPKGEGDDKNFNKRDIKNTTKNPNDFALWKFVEANALQKWKFSDFTKQSSSLFNQTILDLSTNCSEIIDKWGCPGWHSECVAMIASILGKNQNNAFSFGNYQSNDNYLIDLHSGGIEHIPIHHKNEIIQSEALGFHLSKYWTHWKHVLIDGKKMSKSLGNTYLIIGQKSQTGFESIEEMGYDPLAYRLMLFEHHYLQDLNFTVQKLVQSQTHLYNLRKNVAKIQSFVSNNQFNESSASSDKHLKTELLEVGLNNLNYPKMLELFAELILKQSDNITRNNQVNIEIVNTLKEFDLKFFKLELFIQEIIPKSILEKAELRWQKRLAKEWAICDTLRLELSKEGWQTDDYKWGFGIWKNLSTKN